MNDGVEGGVISSSMASLVSVKESIKKFNTKHGERFRRWWQEQTMTNRVKFIRDVYPTIVESPTDRWCLDGGMTGNEGKKTYQEIYRQYVLLMPEFCVEYLSAGNFLPDLFNTWTANESSMAEEMNSRVVNFRRLYRRNAYPWPHPVQHYITRYQRETNLQKGDSMYSLSTVGQGPCGFVADQKLSSNQFIVQKPEIILHGTGETVVEVPGRPVMNLYEMGVFIHPFEFHTLCEVFGVFLHCLVALIDE
eukprot:gene29766-38909_t